jgi:hypothetical protein
MSEDIGTWPYWVEQAERRAQQTQPPPPDMVSGVRATARRLGRLGRHVIEVANDSDTIASRVLRRIGASILDDADSLETAASGLERR